MRFVRTDDDECRSFGIDLIILGFVIPWLFFGVHYVLLEHPLTLLAFIKLFYFLVPPVFFGSILLFFSYFKIEFGEKE